MKRTLFILGVLISFNAYGDAITGDTCGDDCSWRLENGVLTVTGSGRIKGYNRDCSNLESTGKCTTDAPWFDYAENIEKVVIQNKSDNEKFETIGHNAFEDMFYTKEIILPEGIKTIENEAFHGNVALETINLPNTLETISHWGLSSTNLSEINIPDSVTAIGTAAFSSSSLQSLNIPNGATIYGRICDSCEQLETVVFGENITIDTGGENFPFVNTPLLQNVYCQQKDIEFCQRILQDSYKSAAEIENLLKTYTNEAGVYTLEDGTMFASQNDMMNGANACVDMDTCKAAVLKNKGYCLSDEICAAMVASENANHPIVYKNKSYASVDDLLKGKYLPKRIYTIDEANAVAGDKNRVSIKYR